MLRLFLPPNLASAILRDAIPVRLEVDLASEPAPALVPALALLQRWCAAPTPPALLQLTRSQFRELLRALREQPVFFWAGKPGEAIGWTEGVLEGVTPLLGSEVQAQSPTGQPKPAAARPSSERRGTPAVIDGSEHFLAITLPSREHPSYGQVLELLKAVGFVLEPSNRRWWLRDRHKALSFIAEHGDRMRSEWGAVTTENFQRNTAGLARAEVVCSAEEANGGYSLTMAIRAGGASEEAVRQALAGGRAYVEHGGRIYLFGRKELDRVSEAQRALAGDSQAALTVTRSLKIARARVPEAQEILETLSPNFTPPSGWRERSRALRELSSLAPAPVEASLERRLRPYQKLGVAWLWYLHTQRLGGVLADEMGLGKTLQALALLTAIREGASGGRAASLVVVPASLLENWRREAATFAPDLRVAVHHGSGRDASGADFARHDVVVTSYGTLARDRGAFESVEWTCVIADEAQHIKNRRSQNAQALRALPAGSRFVLTGTPLENSLEELRSLFEFLLPGYLGQAPGGLRAEDRQWHDERLIARTAAYILRRTKRAVAPELPEKIEQTVWCEPSDEQRALYDSLRQRGEQELYDLEASGAGEARLRFAMLTQLLRLRQVCCDPRLLDAGRGVASAKHEALLELVQEAVDDGHRMLIFSQFSSALRLLREDLESEGVATCYLDGSMPAKARQAEVDRFQGSRDVPVFLLSLKAGGTGLNLTGADTVVHLDPWWNPAAEAQATDRAHRIGQTRTVTSLKLICSGTVEEKVLALQAEKRALLANVFEASDAAASRLNLADLRALMTS